MIKLNEETEKKFKAWYEEGKELRASHVIIVNQTFDTDPEDIPVYIHPEKPKDLDEKTKKYSEDGYNVIAMYDLSKPFEDQ